jgi:hypothetical protein
MNRPTVFQIDAFGGIFFHGITPNQRGNGFACPLFTFEEAQRLVALSNASDYCGRLAYNAETDTFVFKHDQASDEAPEVYAATLVDGKTYYGVGASSWCWQDVSNDNHAQFSASLITELAEMKRLGMNVPDKAIALATNAVAVEDHANMSVSDAADLLIQLAGI